MAKDTVKVVCTINVEPSRGRCWVALTIHEQAGPDTRNEGTLFEGNRNDRPWRQTVASYSSPQIQTDCVCLLGGSKGLDKEAGGTTFGALRKAYAAANRAYSILTVYNSGDYAAITWSKP